jgi:hypothetical protein
LLRHHRLHLLLQRLQLLHIFKVVGVLPCMMPAGACLQLAAIASLRQYSCSVSMQQPLHGFACGVQSIFKLHSGTHCDSDRGLRTDLRGTLLLLPVLCAVLQLTFTKPHILLLDEPSNHLDIDAVDALIEGLALFKGGVLMVGWGGLAGVCRWRSSVGVAAAQRHSVCWAEDACSALDAVALHAQVPACMQGKHKFTTCCSGTRLLACCLAAAVLRPGCPLLVFCQVHLPLPLTAACLLLLPAAAVQVSHDQYLIESTVDELWCCEGGQVSAAAAAAAAAPITHCTAGAACCCGMQAAASSASGYQMLR